MFSRAPEWEYRRKQPDGSREHILRIPQNMLQRATQLAHKRNGLHKQVIYTRLPTQCLDARWVTKRDPIGIPRPSIICGQQQQQQRERRRRNPATGFFLVQNPVHAMPHFFPASVTPRRAASAESRTAFTRPMHSKADKAMASSSDSAK